MAAYLQEGMLQLSHAKSCVMYPCDGPITPNSLQELQACISHHFDHSLINRPLTRPQDTQLCAVMAATAGQV